MSGLFAATRVKQTSTTTGTGAFALSAVSGFRTFASSISAGVLFSYAAIGSGQWETGIGRLSGGNLERLAVDQNNNGDHELISFTAGTKTIICTQIAVSAQADLVDAWGDAVDGDITFSSGTVTLLADLNANRLIFNGGILDPGGFRVSCWFLDLSSAVAGSISRVAANGGSTTSNVAGAAGAAFTAATIGGGGAGTAGGIGGTAAGATGVSISTTSTGNGGTGGTSGAGGAGSGGAGGVGGTGSAAAANYPIGWLTKDIIKGVSHLIGGGGGRGAGGGGGDGTAGGGGGGGGAGGAVLAIFARIIQRGIGTAAGSIRLNGGTGGSGGSAIAGNRGGGGGGGGAGGGYIYIVAGKLIGTVVTDLIVCDGGIGGVAGNGFGTGVGGTGGAGGSGGRIDLIICAGISQHVGSSSGVVAPVAGGAPSGVTGGTAGAGGQTRVTV